MDSLRLFIALPLPAPLRGEIAAFARSLRPHFPEARWEREEKLHVTMRFLGDVPGDRVGEILAAMGEAAGAVTGFEMTLAGFGAFPSFSRPRVLWVGCSDTGDSLRRLHLALETSLAATGLPPGDRTFHPHVTIARLREGGVHSHLTSAAKSVTFDPRHTLVPDVVLMRSVLRPSGSEYTVIGSARLS